MPVKSTAERRIEKWLTPPTNPGIPADESAAYRAMVDSLMDAMNAVGPTDAITGVTALTKATALMFSAILRLEDDDKVSELCRGQGIWLENEVLALRKAISKGKRSNA